MVIIGATVATQPSSYAYLRLGGKGMRHRFLLGAGVALAVALGWTNAQAQLLPMPAGPGAWYFGGEGGWTSLDNESGKVGGALPIKQTFNDGFNIGARAGYEWGPLRLEEEFRWQHNPQNTLTLGPSAALIPFIGSAGGTAKVSGNRDAYAFMTNAIYDFTFGWPGFSPHLGVGIGAVQLHDSVSIKPGQALGTSCPSLAAGCSFASSTDWEFGYQAIAGVRYNINPALAFDLDYRFLRTTDPSFKTSPNFGGVKYTSGYSSHSVVASL